MKKYLTPVIILVIISYVTYLGFCVIKSGKLANDIDREVIIIKERIDERIR